LHFTHGVSGGSVMKVMASHPHLITAQADTPWAFYSLFQLCSSIGFLVNRQEVKGVSG
jgi:hypothetical protein